MMPEEIKAYIDYGILGTIALSFLSYIWWNAKNWNRILDKKDDYIVKLNDKREETAERFQQTVDELTQRVKELVNLLDRRANQ